MLEKRTRQNKGTYAKGTPKPGRPLSKKVLGLISGNALNAVLNGIFGIFIARILGPADKGILALIGGSTVLLTMFLGMGTQFAASYFARKRPGTALSILRYINLTQAVCLLLSIGLIFLGRDAFSRMFMSGHSIDDGLLGLMIATVVIGAGNAMFGSCVIAKGESRSYTSISLAGTVVTILIFAFLISFLPWPLHGVLAAGLIGQSVATVLFRRKFLDFIPASGHEQLALRVFFTYGFKVQIGSLSNLFFKRADLFIVGYFLDTAAVGFYSIGLGIRELANIIPRSMTGILGGELADPSRSREQKARTLRKSLAGAFAFSVLLAAFCNVVFPYFIPVVYSSTFENAVTPAILIMWSFVPLSLASILTSALTSMGHPLAWSIGNIFSAAGAGALVWVLTRDHGLAGAGMAAILGALLQLAVCAGTFFFYPGLRKELFGKK